MRAEPPRHWCVLLTDRVAVLALLDALATLPPVAAPQTLTDE